MEIYTSYFSNPNIPEEYQKISIANSQPGGKKLIEWKDVIPEYRDVQLLKSQNVTIYEFSQKYRQKLDGLSQVKLMGYLGQFKAPVVLLCWEKNYLECHRCLLAAYMYHYFGVPSEEIGWIKEEEYSYTKAIEDYKKNQGI